MDMFFTVMALVGMFFTGFFGGLLLACCIAFSNCKPGRKE